MCARMDGGVGVCVCDRHGLRRVHECVGWPVLCVCVLCFDLCPWLDVIQLQMCLGQYERARDGKKIGGGGER